MHGQLHQRHRQTPQGDDKTERPRLYPTRCSGYVMSYEVYRNTSMMSFFLDFCWVFVDIPENCWILAMIGCLRRARRQQGQPEIGGCWCCFPQWKKTEIQKFEPNVLRFIFSFSGCEVQDLCLHAHEICTSAPTWLVVWAKTMGLVARAGCFNRIKPHAISLSELRKIDDRSSFTSPSVCKGDHHWNCNRSWKVSWVFFGLCSGEAPGIVVIAMQGGHRLGVLHITLGPKGTTNAWQSEKPECGRFDCTGPKLPLGHMQNRGTGELHMVASVSLSPPYARMLHVKGQVGVLHPCATSTGGYQEVDV